MEKPSSLRQHLVSTLAELAQDPERLKLWVDGGSIASIQTSNFSFSYSYKLNVVITDWSRHPSIIMVLILEWLRRYQPDLVASQAAKGFSFEADILDKDLVDLSIELELDEVVLTGQRPDGGWDMQHVTEPETLFPDELPLEPTGPLLSEIWLEGQPITDPGAAPPLVDAGAPTFDGVIDAGTPVQNRRLQLRRGSAAQWSAGNPVLRDGEPAIESDTARIKYGDGHTAWNDLTYADGPAGSNPLDLVSALLDPGL